MHPIYAKICKRRKNCTVYRLYVIRTNPLENILHLEIPSRSSSNSGHCRRMCYEYSRWKIPRTKIHLQLFTCQIQMLTGRNGAHTHTHTHTSHLFCHGPSIIICSCCSGRKQRDRRCTYNETAVIIWHQPKKYSIMGKISQNDHTCVLFDSMFTLMTPPTNEHGSPWKKWTP